MEAQVLKLNVLFSELEFQYIKFLMDYKKELFLEDDYYFQKTLRNGIGKISKVTVPKEPCNDFKHKGLYWGSTSQTSFYEKSYDLAQVKVFALLVDSILGDIFLTNSKFYSSLTEKEIQKIEDLQKLFKKKALRILPRGYEIKEFYSLFFVTGQTSLLGQIKLKYLEFLRETKLRSRKVYSK